MRLWLGVCGCCARRIAGSLMIVRVKLEKMHLALLGGLGTWRVSLGGYAYHALKRGIGRAVNAPPTEAESAALRQCTAHPGSAHRQGDAFRTVRERFPEAKERSPFRSVEHVGEERVTRVPRVQAARHLPLVTTH
jgi:hypothetical protein